jgi:hypothetical protein
MGLILKLPEARQKFTTFSHPLLIFKLRQGASMGTNCWMDGRMVGWSDGLMVEKSICSKQRRLPELIVHLRLFFINIT